jgi:branched-chain amino acid transport system permease protein
MPPRGRNPDEALPEATAAGRLGGFLRERWDLVALGVLAVAPLVVPALGGALGGQVTTLFIYCILALGLNVMVGYTGLVHLGIAAFFGIGAYLCAILTVPMYPFQMRFATAAAVSVVVTA